MNSVLNQAGNFPPLNDGRDAYRIDVNEFFGFLTERRSRMATALREYATWLAQEHDGKRYTPSEIDRKFKAAKSRIRYAFKKGSSRGIGGNTPQIDKNATSVESERIRSLTVPTGNTLHRSELRELLDRSRDARAGLMVQFLAGTGLHLTEMLAVRFSDLQAIDEQHFEIVVPLDGHRNRRIRIKKSFIERAQKSFQGTIYLFEHQGKPLTADSATRLIKNASKGAIGREITADELRFVWAKTQIHRGKPVTEFAVRLDRSFGTQDE